MGVVVPSRLAWLLVLATAAASCNKPAAPRAATDSAPAIDASCFEEIDRVINDAIRLGEIPGAVMLVGRGDDVLYRKAYGYRALAPQREAMTADTVFDLASLTKPLATATAIMILVERGKIDLHAPASRYLHAFGAAGKAGVTVEQLLLHISGAMPNNTAGEYTGEPAQSMQRVFDLPPATQPGSAFVYSDLGYMTLAEIVRAVDGRRLDAFAAAEIFAPLRARDLSFLPSVEKHDRCAPTQQRNGHWMRGEVHDPRAFALGGVAGHAGLFGAADDVARFCRMILHRGTLDGRRILSESTVEEMIKPRDLPDGYKRAYGFDIDTGFAAIPRGARFDRVTTIGHTGFTGTMFWIDPVNDCYVILLTNSVHPDGKGTSRRVRYAVSTLAAQALLGPRTPRTILNGIDVLKRENFARLNGRRVGVITNHTGVDREGNRLIDLLAAAPHVTLVRLFSPEHGLSGAADEKVNDSTDEKTRLEVVSLYGDTRRPTAKMLDGIDTLVFDIQDVGARYYTYIATLGYCMEEAAQRGIGLVVLDRPNPNGGMLLDGPLADEAHLGFTAYDAIPIVHAMTLGELARMFNAERKFNCRLDVVAMQGWERRFAWEDTDLKWIAPSPNLRNRTAALLYLSLGFLEMSNISVGRGTDAPFEQIGAPWIEGAALAAALNAKQLPGLHFVPVTFTPATSNYAGQPCQGVRIEVTHRAAVNSVQSGLVIARALRRLYGRQFKIEDVGKLLDNDATLEALLSDQSEDALPAVWREPLEKFRHLRDKYLLYR